MTKTYILSVLVLLGLVAACATKKTLVTKDSPTVSTNANSQPVTVTDSKTIGVSVDLTKKPVVASFQHTVVKGECLWSISGDKRYYGDSFMWPVIYKANRDEITDPNVIEVAQVLDFPQAPTLPDVKAAHAQAYAEPTYNAAKYQKVNHLGDAEDK